MPNIYRGGKKSTELCVQFGEQEPHQSLLSQEENAIEIFFKLITNKL